jgi:hypothetical protein
MLPALALQGIAALREFKVHLRYFNFPKHLPPSFRAGKTNFLINLFANKTIAKPIYQS